MLRVLYNPFNEKYDPPIEILQGSQLKSHDKPNRINSIITGLQKKDVKWLEVREGCSMEVLTQVHSPSYLAFLQRISEKLSQKEFIIPDTFPVRCISPNVPEDIEAQAGYYCFDTFTPFTAMTFNASSLSAACAIEGAKLLNSHSTIYALCRPSGHHAQSDLAGGYCFLNNAALAAKILLQMDFSQIAVLDIDFHHGNGTQQIFYDSKDVLTISIHGDPFTNYPYFSGYKDEIGKGFGKGHNINFPLPDKTSDEKYLEILGKALQRITNFNPDALIVPLGFDTYVKDPIGTFLISESCFSIIGSKIHQTEIPTLFIQEGGYKINHQGRLVQSFLTAFLD
ncbi:MAG: histone deacetylase family protein [Promethearchaeota archaeon]